MNWAMGESRGNQDSGRDRADSCWGATSVAGLKGRSGHEDGSGDLTSSCRVLVCGPKNNACKDSGGNISSSRRHYSASDRVRNGFDNGTSLHNCFRHLSQVCQHAVPLENLRLAYFTCLISFSRDGFEPASRALQLQKRCGGRIEKKLTVLGIQHGVTCRRTNLRSCIQLLLDSKFDEVALLSNLRRSK